MHKEKDLYQAPASFQMSVEGHHMKYVGAAEFKRIKESSYDKSWSSYGGHIP